MYGHIDWYDLENVFLSSEESNGEVEAFCCVQESDSNIPRAIQVNTEIEIIADL